MLDGSAMLGPRVRGPKERNTYTWPLCRACICNMHLQQVIDIGKIVKVSVSVGGSCGVGIRLMPGGHRSAKRATADDRIGDLPQWLPEHCRYT
jgi:hypothetical protein